MDPVLREPPRNVYRSEGTGGTADMVTLRLPPSPLLRIKQVGGPRGGCNVYPFALQAEPLNPRTEPEGPERDLENRRRRRRPTVRRDRETVQVKRH